MKKAKSGDTVRVHYKGTLDDGSVFDSSEGQDPIEFTLGSGQIIPGFEEAVLEWSRVITRRPSCHQRAYGAHLVVRSLTKPESAPHWMNAEVGSGFTASRRACDPSPVVGT